MLGVDDILLILGLLSCFVGYGAWWSFIVNKNKGNVMLSIYLYSVTSAIARKLNW